MRRLGFPAISWNDRLCRRPWPLGNSTKAGVLAFICLAIAAALSLALLPDLDFLLAIVGLSLLRAAALSAAFVFLVASGGLRQLARIARPRALSRVWLAILVTGGTLLVLAVCVGLQSVYYPLPFPYPILYFVLVRALPVCLMVGAFWPSRAVFILGVAGALATGIIAPATWNTLHARYEAEEEAARPRRAQEALDARAREIAPTMTALSRVPRDAGVEPLLDFALRRDPHEASEEAATAHPGDARRLRAVLAASWRVRARWMRSPP